MTEYSLKESRVEKYFIDKFPDEPESKETPDVVILITEPEIKLISH